VRTLVDYAESTPAARRTTADFLDAMHLTDELLALLPVAEVRGFRDRLRAVTVRLVRINTVHEEMRYDTPYFAVEAGRPVQLVLRNEDLMPHNLVVTAPGALREVAQLAAVMPPDVDRQGRQYVPRSDKVLLATKMVDPHGQEALTFNAPTEPGEYPYVCTFPNHWMRMYGVMVVVDDLDSWLASPVKPADPIGGSREVVKNWSVDDFSPALAESLRGRNAESGRLVFQEATCLQCHKMKGEGGAVGPDLTDVLDRWKGDTPGVLREILDPSHKIDAKYALYNIVTTPGKVLSGILTAQDADTITVVTDPANPRPQVLPRDDVEELVKTSSSLMPKGLLDRFSRDEVLDLLSFLATGTRPAPAGGEGPSR
jgi:putative heme-binding domain-containing protein